MSGTVTAGVINLHLSQVLPGLLGEQVSVTPHPPVVVQLCVPLLLEVHVWDSAAMLSVWVCAPPAAPLQWVQLRVRLPATPQDGAWVIVQLSVKRGSNFGIGTVETATAQSSQVVTLTPSAAQVAGVVFVVVFGCKQGRSGAK